MIMSSPTRGIRGRRKSGVVVVWSSILVWFWFYKNEIGMLLSLSLDGRRVLCESDLRFTNQRQLVDDLIGGSQQRSNMAGDGPLWLNKARVTGKFNPIV